MKKILFILLLGFSVKASAQSGNPFPTTDSLTKFINKWIRNSAVDAFTNLRLNTALNGLARFIDSSYGGQVRSFRKLNDSTARLITISNDTMDVTLRFGGGSGVTNLDTSRTATQVTITSSTGTSAVIKLVDPGSGKAGLIDTARANFLDKLKAGTAPGDSLYLYRSSDSVYACVFNQLNGTTTCRFQYIDSVGGGGGSGLNQLTGDVTAGPGTGSQVATIASNAVTTSKINNNAVTLGKMATGTANRIVGYDGSGNAAVISPGTGISISGSTISSSGNPTLYHANEYPGIKNDGQFARHASSTSGNATVTCLSCHFLTTAVAGQYFRMDSVGTSGAAWISTVLSITDDQHMVLNASAGTSVASKSIVWGSDNTAGITNLLDTIFVHGGGTAFFDGGGYIIAGALQSTSTTNAQIVLPLAKLGDTTFNLRTGINIQGVANANLTSSAYAYDSIDAHTGTWFESIVDAPDPAANAPAPAVFGSFVNGGTTNYNYFFWQDLTIYTPQNAGSGGTKMGGINCFSCAISQGVDILIASDGSMGSGDLPIHEEAGWIVNCIGSEVTSYLHNVWISGHKYAAVTADHTVLNNFQAFGDNYGVVLSKSGYPTTFVHVGTQQCRVGVYAPNSTILGNITKGAAQVAGEWQIETYTNGPFNSPTVNWWNHFQEVSDSGNNIIGNLRYFSNRNDLFTKQNGNNLLCTQLGQVGNFPTPNTRTFALGDSATTSSTLTIGGKNGTTTGQLNFIYNTTNFSGGGVKFTMGTTDQTALTGDNSGSLGYGTNGTNSGRQLYYFDYINSLNLGGAIGQTGDWVFGRTLTRNGLRVQQPSGNTRSFTVTPTGHLVVDSTDNTSVPAIFQAATGNANSQVYGLLVTNSNSGSGNITNGLQMANELGVSPTHGASIRLLGNASGSPFNSALDLQAWDGPVYVNASGVRDAYFGSAGVQFGTNAVAATDGYLDVVSTSGSQLALHYDGSHKSTFGVNSGGNLTITPSGNTTSLVGQLSISGNITFTASGAGVQENHAAITITDNLTPASSSLGLFSLVHLNIPTVNATNSSVTTSDAYTLYVEGPPSAGTNETFTRKWAGYFGGAINVGGNIVTAVRSISTDVTLDKTGEIITVSASGANRTETLPDATSQAGLKYTIIRTDNSGNTCTVATTSSQNINGTTTYSLTAQYKYVTVFSNGTQWFIVASN